MTEYSVSRIIPAGGGFKTNDLWNKTLGGIAPDGSSSATGDISQMVKYLVANSASGAPMTDVVSTASTESVGAVLASGVLGASPAPTNLAPLSANRAVYVPVRVTKAITLTYLWCFNGGTVSGNVCMALYDASFARLATSGSVAQSGTNTLQKFSVSQALTPGLYFIGHATNNTTGTYFQWTTTTTDLVRAAGVGMEAPAFPLPATATFSATNDQGRLPLVGWTTRASL